ncbi:response regulator transcription factor [Enterovirga sp. CN4-39]|uniref:response regulator transcription factor n=1 Tax=Enterovirga sp. CN4-39 TaxID=3400910 RepID=UPI003C0F89F6
MRTEQPSLRDSAHPVERRGGETEMPVVIIVDDDEAVRDALANLLDSAGFDALCFASTRELLATRGALERPGCLILDVRMPGTSGLDLQADLAQNGTAKPIIFLTGHGDIPMTVQAMKAGAVDFLTKPAREQALLDAVACAIKLDVARRREAVAVARNVERYETLTPREREVLANVVRGRVNKQIAFALGISEVTVKLHRSNGIRKMEVTTLAALLKAWDTLPTTTAQI